MAKLAWGIAPARGSCCLPVGTTSSNLGPCRNGETRSGPSAGSEAGRLLGRRKGRDEVGAEGVLGTEAGAAPCPVVTQTQGESQPHEGWAHPLSPRCLLSALPPSPASRWLLWVPSPVLLLPAARYNRLEGWDLA